MSRHCSYLNLKWLMLVFLSVILATSTRFNFEEFYDKMGELIVDIGFINKIANTSNKFNPLPDKIIKYCQEYIIDIHRVVN